MTALRRLAATVSIVSIVVSLTLGLCQAQWIQAPGPTGGNATAGIKYGGYHFVLVTGMGLYRSGDNGAAWTPCTNGLTSRDLTTLGASQNSLFVSGPTGVFRSRDAGLTWTLLTVDMQGLAATAIVEKYPYLFVSNYYGVHRTADDGDTWTQANTGLPNTYVNHLLVSYPNLYAVVFDDQGLYKSADNGATWVTATTGPLIGKEITGLAARGQYLIAGTSADGIYRSADGGVTWSPSNGGTPSGMNSPRITERESYLYALSSSKGLYRSADSGGTWTKLIDPPVAGLNNWITGNSEHLMIGTNAGVLHSADYGATWAYANQGMVAQSVQSVASIGTDLFIGSAAGLFRTTDLGASLTFLGETPAGIRNLTDAGGGIILGTNYQGVNRSIDNGAHFTLSNTGLPSPSVRHLAAHGGYVFAAAMGSGMYRSADHGATWAPVNSGLTTLTVNSIGSFEGRLFAGGYGNGAFRSDDNGDTWVPSNTGMQNNTVINAFARIGKVCFALASAEGAYKSLDSGRTWTLASSQPGINGEETLIAHQGYLFLGSSTRGAFRSADQGATWDPLNDGLIDTGFQDLALHDGHLIAGTHGAGFWKRPLLELGLYPPLPLGPQNESPKEYNRPTLAWEAAANALTYRVQVSLDSAFTAPLIDDSGLVSTYHDIGPLEPGTLYYWRARSKNATLASPAWSDVMRFTTRSLPATPALKSPADAAAGLDIHQTLSWATVAESDTFHLELAGDAGFTQARQEIAGLKDSSATLPDLSLGSTYFWRVRGANYNGRGPWSPTRSFTTLVALPLALHLKTHATGDTVLADSVLLVWNMGGPKVTGYRVEGGLDSTFASNTVGVDGVQDTGFSFQTPANNAVYFWRVRAVNAAGPGPWAVGRFLVQRPVVGVAGAGLVLMNRGLASGSFRVTLAKRERVRIVLHDIRGLEAGRAADGWMEAGVHEVPLRIEGMRRGVYLLTFRAGAVAETRRIRFLD